MDYYEFSVPGGTKKVLFYAKLKNSHSKMSLMCEYCQGTGDGSCDHHAGEEGEDLLERSGMVKYPTAKTSVVVSV